MIDKDHVPIPPALRQRVRVMQHDLAKLKENVAVGRVKPEQFADLERVLDARVRSLEAEVHARLLDEARRVNVRFRMN